VHISQNTSELSAQIRIRCVQISHFYGTLCWDNFFCGYSVVLTYLHYSSKYVSLLDFVDEINAFLISWMLNILVANNTNS